MYLTIFNINYYLNEDKININKTKIFILQIPILILIKLNNLI